MKTIPVIVERSNRENQITKIQMFIRDTTKTLFEVMSDFDCSCDPEQRWKDLRAGVGYYNEYAGTNHHFSSEILKLYWVFLEASKRLIK